ncbi:MAG: GNAT family N-acetyltransferase [Candidatus Delongbacteria bacterium]|nr:GNAT family N-acetyltransferase [Candidatus Delongbacteria bacterium]MBN2835210.1 GNAT family N-acetyltransferase [Candidatus Delongbacteria bacterium]
MQLEISSLAEHPGFLDILCEWHHIQWGYLYPNGGSIDKRSKRMQTHLTDDFIPSTFIAFNDNNIYGSAAIVECDMLDRTCYTPWIASVFVHENFRSKNVGRKLISHLLSECIIHKIPCIYLYTPDKQEFYKHFGFEVIEERNYMNTMVSIMKKIIFTI